jgi:hypothetical protein
MSPRRSATERGPVDAADRRNLARAPGLLLRCARRGLDLGAQRDAGCRVFVCTSEKSAGVACCCSESGAGDDVRGVGWRGL